MGNKLEQVIELERALIDALSAKRKLGWADDWPAVERLKMAQEDLCVDIESIEQMCEASLGRGNLALFAAEIASDDVRPLMGRDGE